MSCDSLPFVIVDVLTPERIHAARALMIEYRDSISTPLCFQGFDAEMQALPGRYTAPTGCIFLASTPADGYVACIALREIEPGPLGRTCEMKRLYVRPTHRGMGLGRAMCEQLISRAVTLGYGAMRLDTDSYMKEAIGLYRSLGFRPIPKYNNDPIPDTLFFELSLKTAV